MGEHSRIDAVLLLAMGALLAVGEILIYSATQGEPGQEWRKQLIFIVAGLLAMSVIYLVPTRVFYMFAYPAYGLSLALLVFVAATKSGQVERWIPLPLGFKLQPSELAKLGLLLALARHFSLHSASLRDFRSLLAPGLLTAVPFMLVLEQPDLSTALVFAAMFLFMLYWAGMPFWEIFVLVSPLLSVLLTSQQLLWALLMVLLLVVLWSNRVHVVMFATVMLANMAAGYSSMVLWHRVLKEHQRDRISIFLDPMRDPKGDGYQIIQSKVAIGSGGFWGKGLGHGTQTNLSFLPEEHTDFIFSVLGEQFGFVGCTLVILLFFLLLARLLRVCVDLRGRFIQFATVGITAIIGFHAFVNIAMTLGMTPVTGLPLPFVSYGGSFLMTCMTLVGLSLNFRAHDEKI